MTISTAPAAAPAHNPIGSGWRRRNLATGLLLMLAAWIFYLPSLRYDYVYYDDIRILKDHPELYGQPDLAADFRQIFVASFPREEPLLVRDVTWALDSRVFGFGNAFGYHLGNVLLHGVAITLMFAFLLATTRRYRFALAVSIGYLALAIHTEPVAWIMGRKDILSTIFMLLALLAQTRRLTSASRRARTGWYAATLVFFLGGLFSKINVLVFPLALFLHAVFLPYLNGERPPDSPFLWRRPLAREILLIIPSLIISVLVYGWYHRTLAQMGIFDRRYPAHGLAHVWNLTMVDPLAFWVYVQQVFFPWHLKLLYTWPQNQPAYPLWQIIVSSGTILAAVAAGVWLFRQHKDVFFYYAAFFVLMVPYLNLQYIGIWVAERYLYFPSFCILAVAASLAAALLRREQPALRGLALALGIAFMAVNVFQKTTYEPVWRNAETFWQYHLTLPEPSPMAYVSLAAYYCAEATDKKGTPAALAPAKKMAVVVDAGLAQFWPDRRQPPPPATYYLFYLQAIVQELNGDLDAALESLLTSDRIFPRFDDTNLYLARLYRTLAINMADARQRETYLRAGRDRFAEHLEIAYQSRPVPTAEKKEMADFEAACAATSQTAGQADKKTVPGR